MIKFLKKEENDHVGVLFLSLVLSVGGILLASAGFISAADGTRGGAAAVIVSFVSLFINRPHGDKILILVTQKKRKLYQGIEELGHDDVALVHADVDELKEEIEGFKKKVQAEEVGQKKANKYMAWSAAIGTFAWGFGDLVTFVIDKILAYLRMLLG